MSSPSAFSAKGLSIVVSIPLVQGNNNVGNFSTDVNGYTHTISALGGYASADFSISGNNDFLESWLQSGLGRHIQVFGPSMQVIWEGYVNEINANFGSAKFTRGPLSNVANRVSAMYTPILPRCLEVGDPLYDPNCVEDGEQITGVTSETLITEDFDSQKRYGIWESILTLGDAFYADAVYARDLYLEENSKPEGNPTLTIGDSTGELSVEIKCRGYYDWINNYIYNNENEVQWVFVSEQIKTILGFDPNHIISTYYDMIKENSVICPTQYLDNKTAKTIIDDLITLGGGNDDRWTFGVYKDRKVIYAPIPDTVEYVYYKTGRTQQVESLSGTIIEPWDVLPCKWVAIPTILASFPYKIEDVRNDPRVFFGEEVSFTAPDQVNISGAKVRKLSQFLAKLGLGGQT